MLSCKDITEQANAYLDRELPLMKRLSVHMHLFVCVNCRRYMNQMRVTIQALRGMKTDEVVTEEHREHLLQCFRNETQEMRKEDSPEP